MNALASSSAPAALAAPLSFTIPFADLAEFSALPEARRTEVQFTLQLLARVHALRGAGKFTGAVATVAATARHQMRGCSAASLQRKYYLYAGSADWRSLVAHYRGPNALPAEFEQYVKRLAEDNHRSMAEAWELLRTEIWPSGTISVPGYGTWIEWYAREFPTKPVPKVWPRGLYPVGWSKRNLYRHAPNKGARVLFQRGLAAAKKHFPSITRDPSQLRPMELIVIDDFELDCLCVFPGDGKNAPQIAPVAGLLAMCVGTRRKLKWGIGARIDREEQLPDGTTRKVRCGIRRVDVQVLLHGLFAEYGLPDYQITILCENATAAIAPELELALSLLFEGRVKIERTGLINHKTLTNGFVERGGKPWEKGWIESGLNAIWNKLGSMPGYKGSNQRLNAPADLEEKLRVTKLLLGQGERALNLPPEQIAQLRLPFPSPAVVERAFAWACQASDERTAHKYLGFDRVTEFLLEAGDAPRPFAELALLPPDRQQAVEVVERMESPRERWARLAQPMQAVPPAVLALLLLTPKRVSYRNHAVTFVHDKVGYTYVDAAGSVLRGVADGAEFLAYFDVAAPEELHLADLRGAYAGTLTRLGGRRGMIDVRDKDALAAAAAVRETVVNRTLSEVRGRHADQDAQLAADRAHNEAIVAAHRAATAGQTAAEKIAGAANATLARAHAERVARAAANRTVAPQEAAKGLASLVESACAPPAAPAPAPAIAPEETGDDVSLADLT